MLTIARFKSFIYSVNSLISIIFFFSLDFIFFNLFVVVSTVVRHFSFCFANFHLENVSFFRLNQKHSGNDLIKRHFCKNAGKIDNDTAEKQQLKANHHRIHTRYLYSTPSWIYFVWCLIHLLNVMLSKYFIFLFLIIHRILTTIDYIHIPYCMLVYPAETQGDFSLNKQFYFISVRNFFLFFHFTTK